jgi:predicted transcriptional regulator
MANILELNLEDEEQLCSLGTALSSPARIQILKLLYHNSFNVAEIAEKLQIPASSAALYIRSLENAGLINTRLQPGSRGSMKICSRKNDQIIIKLTSDDPSVSKLSSVSMPVGCFTDCEVAPSCGLASEKAPIGFGDRPESFYLPERANAQILWTAAGYVEYKFPYQLPSTAVPNRLILTAELCSEALNYKEDWMSDITFWINDIECGTWRSPGDFGSRLGRLNPEWWGSGSTQYGKLVTLEISDDGCTINSVPTSHISLKDFTFTPQKPISVRIGNKPDAEFIGGFNLFVEKFGDHEQNIILSFAY